MPASSPPPVPSATKALVYDRAGDKCEYCLLASVLLHPDHIVPWSAWEGDPSAYNDPDNLASACYQCNSIKQDHRDGVDPASGESTPLFNPRSDLWADHFMWTEDFLEIVPLTARGRATVARLKLNRQWYKDKRLLLRRAWLGGHDPWP